jgi:hypothetical protein
MARKLNEAAAVLVAVLFAVLAGRGGGSAVNRLGVDGGVAARHGEPMRHGGTLTPPAVTGRGALTALGVIATREAGREFAWVRVRRRWIPEQRNADRAPLTQLAAGHRCSNAYR